MRKIAFIVSLVGFLLLAACNQTPDKDLSTQALDYGEVRFNVVNDFREGLKETSLNGQFDEGEFLIPGMEIKLTPINEKGQVIGEPLSFITNQTTNPLEGTVLKLPVGRYQPELLLPTNLQGGEKYAWKPVGPNIPPLPAIAIDNRHRFDGIYSIACGIGRQLVGINGFDEYPKSPCYSQLPAEIDSLWVSPRVVELCNSQQIQATINASSPSILPSNLAFSVDTNSLPAGMTHSLSNVIFSSGKTARSTLTLSATGVAPGIYTITIRDSRGLSTGLTVTTKGDVVNIPDVLLATAIRQHLNNINIPVTNGVCEVDMLLLTNLGNYGGLHNRIANLEGLQYATNLTSLSLVSNYFSDVTPLSTLTNLTSLNLSQNSISNLAPLSTLTKLTYLDLNLNSISNLTPLSTLTNLTSLSLDDNEISDVTPLSSLTNLTGLSLYRNSISDVTPLSTLTNLTYLVLSRNQISNLTPLSNLTNLTTLSLEDNSTSDVTPLSTLTNLTTLYLRWNSISDITALANNLGLGSGDSIYLRDNPLGLEDPNDPDHQNIQILKQRDVTVKCDFDLCN